MTVSIAVDRAPLARTTNAPYTPMVHLDLPDPWRRLLDEFLHFCDSITIGSKEEGYVKLILLSSQRYLVEEIFWALSLGLRDVVVLKARQLGVSTVLWAFDLWWLLRFPGIQAMYIADTEPNKEIHRDLIRQMYASLPPKFARGKPRKDDRLQLTWNDQPKWKASRLQWEFINKKTEGRLGISRGVNFIHGTELDTWDDRESVGALDASRARHHRHRFYIWEGTGRNYGLLYEMWEQAGDSVDSFRTFLGFWRLDTNVVTRDEKAKWAAYGATRPTAEETEWASEVKRRYHVTVTREQLAFWRYKKAEGKGINGDEAKALEQYPWLPEQAFQATGSAFLSPSTCLRTRIGLSKAPKATTFRYDWGSTFDDKGDEALVATPKEMATLTVWEEPTPGEIYLVAGDPAYGSSEDADRHAATIWRCHPDALVQVAEFLTESGPPMPIYQFAWVLMHLAGSYPRYLIYETNGPGIAVMQEIDRCQAYGFGLKTKHGTIQDVVGGIQEYMWRKADTYSGSYAREWKTQPSTKVYAMEKLRDSVERGALVVRSATLATELAALRRDGDIIKAGGVAHDDLAMTAMMATEHWLEWVVPEIEDLVAPHAPPPGAPTTPVESLVRNFWRRIQEPAAVVAPRYGIRRGPGR